MPKVDRYVGWRLSDGLQMLAFEAELAHLPRSLISAQGVRVSLRVRQFTFSSTSPSQRPDRILGHPFSLTYRGSMRALLPAVLLVCITSTGIAQQPRPYTEGPVVVFSYIRTKPGMFDKYMEYLDGN